MGHVCGCIFNLRRKHGEVKVTFVHLRVKEGRFSEKRPGGGKLGVLLLVQMHSPKKQEKWEIRERWERRDDGHENQGVFRRKSSKHM